MRATQKSEESASQRKFRLYASITILLLVLAAIAIITPRGTPLGQCRGIILGQSRDACFYSLATSTSNQSICASIAGPSAGSCYSSIAESTLSPSICQGAGSNSSQGSCVSYIAAATNNTSLCLTLPLPYRDSCLTKIALDSGSKAPCSSEILGPDVAICTSVINFNLAAATLRPSYCAQVSLSTNKSVLSAIISNTSSLFSGTNSTFLSSISSLAFLPEQNYSARDICYTMLASRASNRAFCLNESASARGLCDYAVANYTNSTPTSYPQLLSSCSQFGKYSAQCTQYVLLAQAINTKNLSICAQFSTMLSYQCYSSIAYKYDNASFCGYIRNSTANNACLLQIK